MNKQWIECAGGNRCTHVPGICTDSTEYKNLVTDRPANCRNRLRDEGKAYPRSGCDSCRNGGIMGCPYETGEKPSNKQYAVIYTDTIHHEGDERSRTHPGHGYPAYSEDVQTLKIFSTEEELKEWLKENSLRGYSAKAAKAIEFTELKYKTTVQLERS